MELSEEFLKLAAMRFSNAFNRIYHGVKQLSDQQIWHRSSTNSNSAGIIWQHLTGNLNQWVCSAVGGESYTRNRSSEFKIEKKTSKEDILTEISLLNKKITEIILHTSPESLLSQRRIQGYDETVMSALIIALTHLELHAGQVLYIAKMLKGKDYIESWKPTNAEQGMN